MKIFGNGCLLDTSKVILYIETLYDGGCAILYKTYYNSGYGEVFRGTYERCVEVLKDIVRSEVANAAFMTLPDK